MKTLVIVESPAKGKTIEKYLGPGYKVLASYGHIMDLPKNELGIDIDHNFKPKYIVPTKARKTVSTLKKAAAEADQVLLATDPDREGEAISWHINEALKLKEACKRIVFHEITETAIKDALNHVRCIDQDLVDAQQARRVLDRLVGYTLSPLLWRKIKKGLSAGRVQSIAVKLIVDREREIEAFEPEEYWDLRVLLENEGQPAGRQAGKQFEAKLFKIAGKNFEIKTADEAQKIENDLQKAEFKVSKVEKKDVKRRPYAPFTTSTLQQDASRKLRYTAKRTMIIAQQLYEGVQIGGEGHVGLITYMRTDSTNLSVQALDEFRKYIGENIGKEYLPTAPRKYKSGKSAQEAHEAIRPTSIFRSPENVKEYLTSEQFKVYELIWKRALASQMEDAIFEQTSIDIDADKYTFRANGRLAKFLGFLKVYEEAKDEDLSANAQGAQEEQDTKLPALKVNEKCNLLNLFKDQKFTEPPARYNEATLIKALEEYGIGRPSTYAPIISTIQDRGYVLSENRRFVPETFGYLVTDLLVANFPDIVNVQFTAHLEGGLDEIAEGKMKWTEEIREFWEPYKKELDKAQTSIEKINTDIPTEEICEKCGKPMVIKQGRFGEFLACTGFPECRNTKPLPPKETGQKCPKCEQGEIVERRTRKGKTFWGCSRYPECDYATWNKPTPPNSAS